MSAMTSIACQTCLDTIENDQVLTKVCGKSCSAQICEQCLGRHVEVTLQQFYPGVLPRVRCPICLVAMHVSRWEGRVPAEIQSTLSTKYTELCRQACVVRPPCCHKTDYTHLLVFDPDRQPSTPMMLLPSQVKKFRILCKQFCCHKLEPRVILDYTFGTFGEETAMIFMNELTLPRIQDSERRATLLLSLMYFRPNTKTKCCGHDFCFNCKRVGHHEACVEEFDENNDLVRCRTCRALLLKVEGCDAVNCVCGFNMNWSLEQKLRRERKKGILPVDIFDIELTKDWLAFRDRQARLTQRIWLQKGVIAARRLLHPVFAVYVWRFRFRKVLNTQLSTAWMARRAKYVDHTLCGVRAILRPATASYIWRRRFSNALTTSEPEIYWKAYNRWHPEEFEAEEEEVSTIFNISVYADE